MARTHHYRRRVKEPTELDITTFLNLMVVLVPFLLISAVFSRITIVELNLPTSSGGGAPKEPAFRVEVIVRESGMEIGNGAMIIAAIPKVDGDRGTTAFTKSSWSRAKSRTLAAMPCRQV